MTKTRKQPKKMTIIQEQKIVENPFRYFCHLQKIVKICHLCYITSLLWTPWTPGPSPWTPGSCIRNENQFFSKICKNSTFSNLWKGRISVRLFSLFANYLSTNYIFLPIFCWLFFETAITYLSVFICRLFVALPNLAFSKKCI